MASFPTLSIGAPTKYPLVRTLVCPTATHRFTSGKEQRYKAAAPYWRIELNFANLPNADRLLVDQFFIDQKGRFGTTWDITIGTVTYNTCRFEQDEISWQEDRPERYSAKLKLTGHV